VLHHTLQNILKLVSFYTATDPETSCSFADRLIDNSLLHAASQDLDQALLQFIHIVHWLWYTLYCTQPQML